MKKSIMACFMAAAMLLSSCAACGAEALNADAPYSEADCFSERDFDTDYSDEKTALIQLNGDTAVCDSSAVSVDGGTVTIADEGAYILTGALGDGTIIVSADKTDKVRLVLDGATVASASSAAIYVSQADKVFVTLAPDSVNTLSNGGGFSAIGDDNVDAVIFSKDDITLNGSGSLTISSPSGHGIVSKDELRIVGGAYTITAASHGMEAKDGVCVSGATLSIASGKDGIHAENADDAAQGFVYISGGTFDITAQGDGISAAARMQLDGGDFVIAAGGGSANASQKASEGWGGFPGGGGGRGGFGAHGGRPDESAPGTAEASETDDTSAKGVKAAGSLLIQGGSLAIDSADDAVHSNASVTVSGGTFDISTGDDGIHADDTLSVTGGKISISQSYEGLEALHIDISGGEISLVASDDGLNAAGGVDESGFGGFRKGDRFGGMGGGSSDGSIVISGGSLDITSSGDGIDANGTLTISGGYTVVCGPTQGDTATLDYDVSAAITGGTFIGTGSSMMAQTFSDSAQGVIAVRISERQAGTAITLTDADGNMLLTQTPELPYVVIILSSPELVKGNQYTLTVGDDAEQIAAS